MSSMNQPEAVSAEGVQGQSTFQPLCEMCGIDHHGFSLHTLRVNFPVTSLRSLGVGSTEARDVNIALDTEGRLPVGLLGQSFLRRFKMTVDPQSGQVTFDR